MKKEINVLSQYFTNSPNFTQFKFWGRQPGAQVQKALKTRKKGSLGM